ncbi:alpha/beta hydrolase [uncultured Pseudodesulfovibrio sp.]|uniref:alpha/beta fold hydrolase n=1 Tax=uncultured Pseudodesulfovibrio sp. TaxID=2035858 RepID=UPI0029C95DDE|nr:alpha/beta hydrolase [uncultured Pseudodesulfovibrio sp.]
MAILQTKDGVEIYYKDWGSESAQPIVFHHGWPLTADEWDSQMLYFLDKGFRVIAFDRRGDGRSTQVGDGINMDNYAADTAELVNTLDLRDTVQIGHSTGGGVVARYVAGAEKGRVAKAVLLGAVPPIMVKSDSNPEGTPIEVFDGFREQLLKNRAQFYHDVASGPFYGFNRDNVEAQPGVVLNWWRQGMMGGVKAQYDCVKVFSETDFTEDLKKMDVPTLVMHGEDDQVVPIQDAAMRSIKMLKNGTLKTYPGYPHGMATIHADVINKDILAFIQGN